MSVSTKQKAIQRQVNVILLAAVVCLIPVNLQFIAPLIGVYLLSSIILVFSENLKLVFNRANFLLIIFYAFLGLGVFWSKNISIASFDLEVKMSLFIFPLVMLFVQYDKRDFKTILTAFYIGLCTSSFALIVNALSTFWVSGNTNDLFYVNLSPYIHPSYLSLYFVVGMVFLLISLKRQCFKESWKRNLVIITVLYFFLFNLFLLSKIGVLVATSFLIYFILSFVLTKKKFGLGVVLLGSICFIFYLSYQKSPYIKQRVDEMVSGFTANKNDKNAGSTGIRIEIWHSAITVIEESPFIGYGTGDVKAVLMQQYRKEGHMAAYGKKLNAHNQFLQILIAVGFVGLFIFIFAIFTMLKSNIANRNLYATCFLVIAIIYMLPESLLENQAGTIFFGLFYALLNQKSLHENSNSNSVLSA